MKARDVILKVEHLGKTFRSAVGTTVGARRHQFLRPIGANFCASSGRPAAASPLSFAFWPALKKRPAAQVLLDGKPVSGPGQRSRHGVPGLHAVSLADGQEERDVRAGSQRRGR